MTDATHPASKECDELGVGTLLSLLISARWYVEKYEPADYSESYDRDMLLGDIDRLFPPEPMVPLCGEQYCCRPKGHEGAHDDIPF